MSKFKYNERSADTVAARAKQQGGSYDSYLDSRASFIKIKEGRNDLRIMPPTWDPKIWGDNWGIEVYVHRDIGPDNNVYFCLDEMRKKYGSKVVPAKLGECPICDARREIEGDEDAAKKLKPGKQILCYVINRDAEKDGPLVWRMGWQLERDIQLRSQEKSGAVIPIDHPDRGFDVSFNREGSGLKTKYLGVDIARNDSPLAESVKRQDGWLDHITDNPLTELLIFFDADYVSKIYSGKAAAKADEEDDRPTRSSRGGRDETPEEDDRRGGGRSRGRDQDEGEEEDRRGRGRGGRDEPDEEEDRSSRSRSRDDDDRGGRGRGRDDDRERSRSRRDEPDEEDDRRDRPRAGREDADDDRGGRSRSRGRDADDDDALPDDAQMARNSERARSSRSRDEEPPARARSSRGRDADDDDKDPGDDADDDKDDGRKPAAKTTDRAKASLDRLKGGADKGGKGAKR